MFFVYYDNITAIAYKTKKKHIYFFLRKIQLKYIIILFLFKLSWRNLFLPSFNGKE